MKKINLWPIQRIIFLFTRFIIFSLLFLAASTQSFARPDRPADIELQTQHGSLSSGSIIVTKDFEKEIEYLELQILSGHSDGIGFVGSKQVTDGKNNCKPSGLVFKAVDVTSEVTISGSRATFRLIDKENCKAPAGWHIPAQFKWTVWFKPCSKCTQVSCPANIMNKSVEFNLPLGLSNNGDSSSSLILDEKIPSIALSTPAKLLFLGSVSDFIVRSPNGSLRQVKTNQTLADIVVLNNFSYEIRLYTSANAGSLNGSLYVPVGNYFKKIVIENPDGNVSFNRLKISDIGEADVNINEFVFDPNFQQWELVSGNGLVRESRSSVIDPITQDRIETHTIRNQDLSIAFKEINTFRTFAWGEEKIKEVLDPDGAALTTTWEFITDTTAPGYKKVRQMVQPSGYWERYEYDSLGRQTKMVAQYLDAPLNSFEDLNRLTATLYSINEPHVTTVELLLGQEISRRYTVNRDYEVLDIQTQESGAAFNHPKNLITRTISGEYLGFVGTRLSRVVNPNGTESQYDYIKDNNNQVTTTVKTGVPSLNGIIDGIKTVTVVDAKGIQLSKSVYDIKSGLLLTSSTTTQFDPLGRPTRVEYNNGTFTTTTYNCCGATTETDQEGIETIYTYDALKRVVSTTRAGITTRLTYDAVGNVLRTVRIGNDGSEIDTNVSTFDVAGRWTSSKDALNQLTTYSELIDGNGHTVKTTTYPDNTKRIETYFKDGSLLSISGNAVHPVKYEYGFEPVFPQDPLPPPDEPSRFTKEIRIGANGAETEWTKTYFDMLGRPYKTVLSGGGFSKSSFNDKGQLIREIDPDGVNTLFAYNAKGELDYQALDVDSNREMGFDGKDRITQIQNDVVQKNGITVKRTTTKVYTTENSTDTKTVSIIETTPDGLETWENRFGLIRHTKTILEGQGKRTVVVTDPDGTVTTSRFLNGRIVSSDVIATDLFISSKSYQYDPHGRLSMITDEQGVTTNGVFYDDDKLKLIIMIGGSDGKIQNTAFNYDVMGRLTTTTENGLAPVSRTYWPTGELKSLSGFGTYPQSYTCDTQGRLKTLKTGNNANTTWNYDPVSGFLTSKSYHNGKGPSYTYSPGGRLLTRTWARGIVTTYGYNFVGDLNEITYSDGTPLVTFSIDRMGKIKQIYNSTNGAQNFTYNDANLPLTEGWSNGGPLDGIELSHTYDTLQRRTSVSLRFVPASPIVQTDYEYDSASRIKLVSDVLHDTKTNYTYIPNSPLIESLRFENNSNEVMQTDYTYDGLSRLTKINSSTQINPDIEFAYTYNQANERNQVDLTQGRWLYEYDGLGQVISGKKFPEANNSTPEQDFRYSFDQIGNRTSKITNGSSSTYQVNRLNQYTSRTVSATSENFNYDADGNLVKDAQFKYAWDAENRLISVESLGSIDPSTKKRLEFVYDPLGRRIAKKIFRLGPKKKYVLDQTQFCLYDGWNKIAQTDTNGVVHSYTWGLDLSGSLQGAGGVGGLLTMYNGSDGTSHAYAYDGNGNVSSLVNMSSRQISAKYEYGPFGELIESTGPMANINPYQFSTKHKDIETGLLYYGYRYLNTNTGRWVNRDPIGERGEFNLYGFVGNDGVNKVDMLGLEPLNKLLLDIYITRLSRRATTSLNTSALHYDLLTSSLLTFNDDGSLLEDTESNRLEFYGKFAKGKISNDWKKIEVPMTNAPSVIGGSFFASTFDLTLANSQKVLAVGSYEAKCIKGGVAIRNVHIQWRWHDNVDANSLGESWDRGRFSQGFSQVLGALGEGLVDFAWDKVAGADFDVIIHFNDNDTSERRWYE